VKLTPFVAHAIQEIALQFSLAAGYFWVNAHARVHVHVTRAAWAARYGYGLQLNRCDVEVAAASFDRRGHPARLP